MLWWKIEEDMGIDKMPGNWKDIRKVRLCIDKDYYEKKGFPKPGRAFYASYKYEF